MCRSRDAGSRIGVISAGKRVIGTTTAIDTPGTRAPGNTVTTTMTTRAIMTTTAGATAGGSTIEAATAKIVSEDLPGPTVRAVTTQLVPACRARAPHP
jgi:hypothetical protein